MKKALLVLLFVFLSVPLYAGEQPMEGSDAPSFKLQAARAPIRPSRLPERVGL